MPAPRSGWLGPAIAVLLLLSAGPAIPATAAQDSPPAWYDAGVGTLLDDLYHPGFGAIVETAEPIDDGDVWAWTGDNGKALAAIAPSRHRDDPRAASMARFVASMQEGPVAFQRRANTDDPVVLARNDSAIAVSNHLLTLRADRRTGRVEASLEYHDGRDRRMVGFGPPAIRVDGSWRWLRSDLDGVRLVGGPGDGSLTVRLRYAAPGLVVRESYRLDAHPRIRHVVEAVEVPAGTDRIRLQHPDMLVRRPLIDAGPTAYRKAYVPGVGVRSVDDHRHPIFSGPELAEPWTLHFARGRTDAFAPGLGVRFEDPDRLLRATAPADSRREGGPSGGLDRLRHVYAVDGAGTRIGEDLVLLDGVVTGSPEAYGPILTNVTAPRYRGVDVSLLYELGDAVHGTLAFADRTGRHRLRKQMADRLAGYLASSHRGVQTRSLSGAILASLDLHQATGDPAWLDRAVAAADRLGSYRITDPGHPLRGGVRVEPDGGVFLDSTARAARAWRAVADATGEPRYDRWADRAWDTVTVRDGRIVQRQPGNRTEVARWAFQSALVLQAAPDVPDESLWAARNHLWSVIDDPRTVRIRTSADSPLTNSETQAWGLTGMLRDHRTRTGPAIVDAEAPLERVEGPPGAVRLRPERTPTRIWLQPDRVPYDDGRPLRRNASVHGTWRVTLRDATTFWPTHRVRLQEGWNAVGAPGREAPVPTARLLGGAPIEVAWGLDGEGRWSAWVPSGPRGGLDRLRPGQGLLVIASANATVPVADKPGPWSPRQDTWQLLAVPPETEGGPPTVPDGLAAHPLRTVLVDLAEAEDGTPRPFSVVLLGPDGAGSPPDPPTLVHGTVTGPGGLQRGGRVVATVEDRVLAGDAVGLEGRYRLQIQAPSGVDVEIAHVAGDGGTSHPIKITTRPGRVVQQDLVLPEPVGGLPPSLQLGLLGATGISLAALWVLVGRP